MTWGKSTQPFNNGYSRVAPIVYRTETVVLSTQDTANFQIGLQNFTATGGEIGIAHNVQWLYQNSTFLTYPSVYTTNLQMSLIQPLLGSAPFQARQPLGRWDWKPTAHRSWSPA